MNTDEEEEEDDIVIVDFEEDRRFSLEQKSNNDSWWNKKTREDKIEFVFWAFFGILLFLQFIFISAGTFKGSRFCQVTSFILQLIFVLPGFVVLYLYGNQK